MVRKGCVFVPTLFNTCVVCRCRKNRAAEVGAVRTNYLDFAEDTVIIAEPTTFLWKALDEAEPLRPRVSLLNVKVQALANILDPTIESKPLSCENVEVTQTFTSVIYLFTVCNPEERQQCRA